MRALERDERIVWENYWFVDGKIFAERYSPHKVGK
jgi:hypothetical protein